MRTTTNQQTNFLALKKLLKGTEGLYIGETLHHQNRSRERLGLQLSKQPAPRLYLGRFHNNLPHFHGHLLTSTLGYSGEVNRGTITGLGEKLNTVDSSYYLGHLKDGTEQGFGVRADVKLDKDSKVVNSSLVDGVDRLELGYFINGYLSGLGCIDYFGFRYFGLLDGGESHGVGSLFGGKEEVKEIVGRFKDGLLDGLAFQRAQNMEFVGFVTEKVKKGYGYLRRRRDDLDGLGEVYEVYEGVFSKGRYHGIGILLDLGKKSCFKGHFKLGVKQGFGRDDRENTLYIGGYHNGLRHGLGLFLDKKSKIVIFGEWSQNELNGVAMEVTAGTVYKGVYKDGRRHGEGILTNKNDEYYENRFRMQRTYRDRKTRDILTKLGKLDMRAFLSTSKLLLDEIEGFIEHQRDILCDEIYEFNQELNDLVYSQIGPLFESLDECLDQVFEIRQKVKNDFSVLSRNINVHDQSAYKIRHLWDDFEVKYTPFEPRIDFGRVEEINKVLGGNGGSRRSSPAGKKADKGRRGEIDQSESDFEEVRAPPTPIKKEAKIDPENGDGRDQAEDDDDAGSPPQRKEKEQATKAVGGVVEAKSHLDNNPDIDMDELFESGKYDPQVHYLKSKGSLLLTNELKFEETNDQLNHCPVVKSRDYEALRSEYLAEKKRLADDRKRALELKLSNDQLVALNDLARFKVFRLEDRKKKILEIQRAFEGAKDTIRLSIDSLRAVGEVLIVKDVSLLEMQSNNAVVNEEIVSGRNRLEGLKNELEKAENERVELGKSAAQILGELGEKVADLDKINQEKLPERYRVERGYKEQLQIKNREIDILSDLKRKDDSRIAEMAQAKSNLDQAAAKHAEKRRELDKEADKHQNLCLQVEKMQEVFKDDNDPSEAEEGAPEQGKEEASPIDENKALLRKAINLRAFKKEVLDYFEEQRDLARGRVGDLKTKTEEKRSRLMERLRKARAERDRKKRFFGKFEAYLKDKNSGGEERGMAQEKHAEEFEVEKIGFISKITQEKAKTKNLEISVFNASKINLKLQAELNHANEELNTQSIAIEQRKQTIKDQIEDYRKLRLELKEERSRFKTMSRRSRSIKEKRFKEHTAKYHTRIEELLKKKEELQKTLEEKKRAMEASKATPVNIQVEFSEGGSDSSDDDDSSSGSASVEDIGEDKEEVVGIEVEVGSEDGSDGSGVDEEGEDEEISVERFYDIFEGLKEEVEGLGKQIEVLESSIEVSGKAVGGVGVIRDLVKQKTEKEGQLRKKVANWEMKMAKIEAERVERARILEEEEKRKAQDEEERRRAAEEEEKRNKIAEEELLRAERARLVQEEGGIKRAEEEQSKALKEAEKAKKALEDERRVLEEDEEALEQAENLTQQEKNSDQEQDDEEDKIVKQEETLGDDEVITLQKKEKDKRMREKAAERAKEAKEKRGEIKEKTKRKKSSSRSKQKKSNQKEKDSSVSNRRRSRQIDASKFKSKSKKPPKGRKRKRKGPKVSLDQAKSEYVMVNGRFVRRADLEEEDQP